MSKKAKITTEKSRLEKAYYELSYKFLMMEVENERLAKENAKLNALVKQISILN